jgi:hypothetical protein
VATATSGIFPGNVLVNFADGMVAAQVTIEVTPRVGAPFTHRSRASFVREQWRTYTVFLASQCASAAVQLQCSSMSAGGVEFVCGSADPANPCVPVEQQTTRDYEPAADSGVPQDSGVPRDASATDVADVTVAPAIVPAAIAPWTGARLSTSTVGFRWRLMAGATQGRVALCSDYACTTETMTSAVGATSATMTIAPGRYAYRVSLLDAASMVVGYTAPRPFEVLATGAARAVAVGTSMYTNHLDFDRDFAVGTRTQSGLFRQVSIFGDTFSLPVSGQITAQPDFGRSIANLGDFNGDGFSEVLVASQAANDTAVRAPAILLRIPNTRMPRAFDFANVQFGHRNITQTHPAWAVGGGDVNGDGYSDMVIGAPSNDGTIGTTTVIYGYDAPTSANFATATSSTITGNSPAFGGAVVSGCDFDGDGFADFAVSSVALDPMDNTPRPVRVFFGGASAPFAEVAIDPPASLPNGARAQRWGSTLACGADLDGDGRGDLAISDITARIAATRVGAVTAWSLARRAPTLLFEQTGAVTGDTGFGHAMTMGTIPFAGQESAHVLVVGTPRGGTGNGEVKVYRYNRTTTPEMIVMFNNFPAGGFGGSSVGIADINGFGRPRDAAVLMGVLGRGLDTSMPGMPPLPRDGCIYAIAPRSLPAGLTTTWTTLTAWEPATGEGLGATMAH